MTDGGQTFRAVNAVSKANEAATLAAVEPHLEPGEEILAICSFKPKGGKWSIWWGPRIELTPAIFEVPEAAVVAVTPHRFLITSYPHQYGTDEDASRLLITLPLDEVRDVRVAKAGGGQKELSWTAGGTRYTLWVNGSSAKEFVAALPSG